MRMVIVAPPHTSIFWLRVIAKMLSTKHPDVVVLGPVDTLLHGQLDKYKVHVVDPPSHGPPLTGWWGKVKEWWSKCTTPDWDPWNTCDVVLVLWDSSPCAIKSVQRAKAQDKKVWIVKITHTGGTTMNKHH